MRSLQPTLHCSWNQVDNHVLVQWDDCCFHDLSWWLDPVRLEDGVSLAQVSPNLDLWSNACDVDRGAHLGQEVVSGQWSPEDAYLSSNARELLAVERGLLHFQSQVLGSTVAVFADNSTAVAYLRKSGHSLGDSELHHTENSPVGGGPPHPSSPSIHHGKEQYPRGRFVQAQSDPGLQVDAQVGGISGAPQEVAGVG